MLLITLVSLGVRGMSYGVDFSGGRAFVVRFDQPVTANEVREALGDVSTGTGYEVKQFGQDNQMRIVTQYKYDDEGDNVTAEIEDMLYKALSPLMTAQHRSRIPDDGAESVRDHQFRQSGAERGARHQGRFGYRRAVQSGRYRALLLSGSNAGSGVSAA